MTKYTIPFVLFIVVLIVLGIGLRLNPKFIPSPLINKPVPAFDSRLLGVEDRKLSHHDLEGQVWLLNVWASWCSSCRQEHAVLTKLGNDTAVTIIGLDYKDKPEDAIQWLTENGNPYLATLLDDEGRIGIDFGVYGIPETYVIDKKGIVRYKHTGPITLEDAEQTLKPMIAQLNAESL